MDIAKWIGMMSLSDAAQGATTYLFLRGDFVVILYANGFMIFARYTPNIPVFIVIAMEHAWHPGRDDISLRWAL